MVKAKHNSSEKIKKQDKTKDKEKWTERFEPRTREFLIMIQRILEKEAKEDPLSP